MSPAIIRAALLSLAFVAAAGAGFAVYLAARGWAARPHPADVAVVFGNTVERTGLPSRRLRARLDAALELYSAGVVPLVVVSGGTGKEGFNEAEVMQAYLVQHGVPAQAIHADSAGVNTEATCANVHAFMRERGLRSADVVTQYFHIVRATMACRRAGVAVVGGHAPRFFEPRDLYSLVREVLALPVNALRGRRAA